MVTIVMVVKFGKILRHCTDKQSNSPLILVFTYLTYCSTQSVITNNKISSSFISEVNVSTSATAEAEAHQCGMVQSNTCNNFAFPNNYLSTSLNSK